MISTRNGNLDIKKIICGDKKKKEQHPVILV